MEPLHSAFGRPCKVGVRTPESAPASLVIGGKAYRRIKEIETERELLRSNYRIGAIATADGQRVAIKVEPQTKNYSVVGVAFDYLLRFELQRRAPHAITREWMAQAAANDPWKYIPTPEISRWADVETLQELGWYIPLAANGLPGEGFVPINPNSGIWVDGNMVTRRVTDVLNAARAAVDAYVQMATPTIADQRVIAAHAIRLANLDSVYRRIRLEPDFEKAAPEDVQDLVDLLAIVPFSNLMNDRVLLLNPAFGDASRAVGGADADLIVGDMLIDIKTTKKDAIKREYLNQILGYFMLAHMERSSDPTIPVINRIGLYYSRYGHLHSFEASSWTDHPAFPETERWFVAAIEALIAKRRMQTTVKAIPITPEITNGGRLSRHTERVGPAQKHLIDHCAICQSIAKNGDSVYRAKHCRHECQCPQHKDI